MLFEHVRNALAKQFEIDPETITAETNLIDDLGADSLDVVELMMFIEESFDLAIPDDVLHTFHTVGDVVTYVDGAKK